ncbi:zf-HC2 domain-containing protein [Xylanimonas oleitrophica]|uniref:Zf-HC2 domain-containing protein n=1 Tax=Xylanimonas oleitrophica TaxID=2607479 RepID=A0A2W5WWR7_9MICO|nr:zf-HC2 domain-containing protein [Xylanimonas oleitrophica]PZR55092.1 zf-HC2 domain-containing protein [Xylanimonas oleitrophica]
MTAGHLGSWLSALADGQLPPDQAERALSHVAVCGLCAAELEAAREARRALAAAQEVHAAPDLTARLLALSATVPPTQGDPLRERPQPGPWSARAPWEGTLTGDLAASARRRRVRRAVGVGVGGLGAAAAALFAVGNVPVVVPDPSPQHVLTLLARTGPDAAAAGQDVLGSVVPPGAAAVAAGLGPGTDARDAAALDWVGRQGWVSPDALPAGLDVTALRLVGARGEILELDLSGEAGHVVVREQVGRLAPGTGTTQRLGGREVAVLSSEPWHVAWQCDDVVVDVAADVPQEVLEQVLTAFPGDGYDAGVLPRIARGWSVVTGTATGAQPQP